MHATPAGPAPFVERVRDTFVAPRRLFAALRGTPPWFDVLLVSTAVAVLVAATLPDEAFLEQVEGAVNRRGRPVEITSPAGEIARWGRYLAMLSALAAHPLIAFLLAGLLALLFSVVGGGGATFREYLAVASHALLVLALGSLVTLLAQWATADPWLEISLGLALPGDGVVQRVLAGISPFTVWMVALLAVGVGELNRTISAARAAAILLGLYLALAVALATVS